MNFIFLYSIFFGNLLFSFILSLFVYIKSQKYYKPCIKKDKYNNKIDLHKIYDAFHPHDEICFIKLWIGAFFCAFIKLISSLFIVVFINLHIRIINKIYKNCETNFNQRLKMKKAISFWSFLFLFMNGIRIEKKFPEYEHVYKKYFGQGYDFNDNKYSLIISNHIINDNIIKKRITITCGEFPTKKWRLRKPVHNKFFYLN